MQNSLARLAGGAALSALALAVSVPAFAQETTAAVRGRVVGEDGAPISGAAVTIVHTPSGARAVTASNSDGVFDARGLRVGGPYTVTIAAQGFETRSVGGVNLGLGQAARLDFDMIAESAVSEVTVVAARNPEADNTAANATLSRDTIVSVVSVNRDIRDVARRNLLASTNTGADGGISIAGSNPKLNRITIDGSPAQDDFGLNSGGLPTRRGPVSLDAVEQITVEAAPIDVENGDFQGGAINIVLRSGGNAFHGSAFVNYLNDGMVGDSIRDVPVRFPVSQKNYGGFLSGPIWRDKLFFAISYETYETVDVTPFGPTGAAGYANSIRDVTQATLDNINTSLGGYAVKFTPGGLPTTAPIIDRKYSAKLDWNINDNHRLSFTHRYALSEFNNRNGLSSTNAVLNSQWYLSGEEDYSYVAELNSRWSDAFTTQVRVSYRDYERRQAALSGNEFADIRICSALTSSGAGTSCESPASQVRFGPDEFRQANELETHNITVDVKGEYVVGPNVLKAGYQYQQNEIYNLFVGRSDGVYYFDSLADFRNGLASQFLYRNAPTNDPTDAAAAFTYSIHSWYLQDTTDITDALQVTAGFRFDWYKSADKPIRNPFFAARNGFDNLQTYDGMSIAMPRLGVKFDPKSWYRINGGAGLFAGGMPDVLIATSYSTTGYATVDLDIRRNADGTFSEANLNPNFTQAIGASALNVNRADARFGFDLPSQVTGLLSPDRIAPNSEVITLEPGFKVPASWKFFVSGQFDLPLGLQLTADYVQTEVQQAVAYRDLRVRPLTVNGVQQFTPDGRIRYDGLSLTDAQRAAAGVGGTNVVSPLDLLAYNTGTGHGFVAGVGLSKTFDQGLFEGLDMSIGYARQNLVEQTSGTRLGTTSGSLYASQATGFNPNEDAIGTSAEQVRDRVKLEMGYRKKFFGDNETRFSLFAEARSGRPVSVVMGDPGGFVRSTTFGTNRSGYLMYVPDIAGDTNPNDLNVGLVTFADAATRDNFLNFVRKFGLPTGVTNKGAVRNPDINQVDLQVSQELPTPVQGHKFKVVFDIQNVLNLLNNKWGLVEEYGPTAGSSSQGILRVVDATCATATGAAAGAASPVCVRYRYSNFNPTALTRTINNERSLWYAQVSLRYQF